MIKTENLSKIYQTDEVETTALNQVNFEIKEGEFVSVMGPSGCGKSTLLNVIGMIDNPTSGQYFFNGEEVGHLPERKRSNIRKHNLGFVFQSFNLIDELTVFENVELPMLYTKVPSAERKKGGRTPGRHEYHAPEKPLSAATLRWSATTGSSSTSYCQ